MNRLIACLIAAAVLATEAGSASVLTLQRAAQPVRIAAAADLQYALDDVITRLRARDPDLRIVPTYGSSGQFHAQLRQRAPFDLYLSADEEYPRDLVRRGMGAEEDLFVYARGRLVVWTAARSDVPVERDGARAVITARRIAIANPRHAPYGRAAEEVLRGAGLWSVVQPRLVIGENVAQAAHFARSGAADVAFIARALAWAPAMRHSGRFFEIPAAAHAPLRQGGLILPWARKRAAAVRVRDYLLGSEGQALLASHGFEAVRERSVPSDGPR